MRADSVCSFDFAFTGRSSPAEFEGASNDKLVCLVLKDSHTGAMHAVPTPAKGGPVAFKYLVAEVCRFLNYCGHESVTVRSDGEPACLALQQGIKAFRTKMGLQTHLEQTEPGDHQSNASEQAIDSIRQLAGCILISSRSVPKRQLGPCTQCMRMLGATRRGCTCVCRGTTILVLSK